MATLSFSDSLGESNDMSSFEVSEGRKNTTKFNSLPPSHAQHDSSIAQGSVSGWLNSVGGSGARHVPPAQQTEVGGGKTIAFPNASGSFGSGMAGNPAQGRKNLFVGGGTQPFNHLVPSNPRPDSMESTDSFDYSGGRETTWDPPPKRNQPKPDPYHAGNTTKTDNGGRFKQGYFHGEAPRLPPRPEVRASGSSNNGGFGIVNNILSTGGKSGGGGEGSVWSANLPQLNNDAFAHMNGPAGAVGAPIPSKPPHHDGGHSGDFDSPRLKNHPEVQKRLDLLGGFGTPDFNDTINTESSLGASLSLTAGALDTSNLIDSSFPSDLHSTGDAVNVGDISASYATKGGSGVPSKVSSHPTGHSNNNRYAGAGLDLSESESGGGLVMFNDGEKKVLAHEDSFDWSKEVSSLRNNGSDLSNNQQPTPNKPSYDTHELAKDELGVQTHRSGSPINYDADDDIERRRGPRQHLNGVPSQHQSYNRHRSGSVSSNSSSSDGDCMATGGAEDVPIWFRDGPTGMPTAPRWKEQAGESKTGLTSKRLKHKSSGLRMNQANNKDQSGTGGGAVGGGDDVKIQGRRRHKVFDDHAVESHHDTGHGGGGGALPREPSGIDDYQAREDYYGADAHRGRTNDDDAEVTYPRPVRNGRRRQDSDLSLSGHTQQRQQQQLQQQHQPPHQKMPRRNRRSIDSSPPSERSPNALTRPVREEGYEVRQGDERALRELDRKRVEARNRLSQQLSKQDSDSFGFNESRTRDSLQDLQSRARRDSMKALKGGELEVR